MLDSVTNARCLLRFLCVVDCYVSETHFLWMFGVEYLVIDQAYVRTAGSVFKINGVIDIF